MANLVVVGGDGALFVGEDKTFRLELLDSDDVPVDMGTMEIVFDVRSSDSSSTAILSLTADIDGTYDDDRQINEQRAIVTVTDTQMNLFKARTYRYSWKRQDDGSETVLAYGDFVVEKATAP